MTDNKNNTTTPEPLKNQDTQAKSRVHRFSVAPMLDWIDKNK